MKEDILEQLVDGYFLRETATFTKHNVKYKPNITDISHLDRIGKSKYSVSSDIDVIAIHLNKMNNERVSVVSCKSWQDGFDIDYYFKHLIDEVDREKIVGSGNIWKKFRELVEPTWAKAFREKVFEETNSNDFNYYIAVTKIKNKKDNHIRDFEECELFLNNLSDFGKHNVKIHFLPLEKIIEKIFSEKTNTTLEATEIGRFIQLIKASGLKISK